SMCRKKTWAMCIFRLHRCAMWLQPEHHAGRARMAETHYPMVDEDSRAVEELPAARSPGPARRILVVDDEPETATGLAAILREDGHQVDVVASAEEALERFSANT